MPSHVVTFSVPFVKGKGRVRFVRQTGRTYTPDSTAQAMYEIRDAWLRASSGQTAPKGTPVRVSISTARPIPKSRPKRVWSEPDVYKPDVDNLAKCALDALNGVAWVDDTQVTSLSIVKLDRDRECEHECTVVTVSWEEEGDSDA